MAKKKNNIDWFGIVLSDTFGGGSELQQINFFKNLVKQNHYCMMICLGRKNMGCWEFMEQKGKVVYFPFGPKWIKLNFLLLYPYLIFVFSRYRIRYTFSTQTLINSAVGLFKRIGFLKKTKVVVRESNSIFKLLKGIKLQRYKLGYKIGYQKVDLVICQTVFMKEQLLESIPWLRSKKVVVIENPIDLEDIAEKSKVPMPELSQSPPYIVAAGSLHPKKGFDILIDAFERIKDKWPKLNLYILGEGAQRPFLEEKIKALNLNNRVYLKGFQTNVFPFFKMAQSCVMSSRIEGFPNVLLQMMSQNNSVVSTLSAGGIDKIPGIYTCPTKDVEALAISMENAMVNDNSAKRAIFNEYLEKRSVQSFYEKIMGEIIV
ncbi:glycosyltransferase [Flagellimonas beolgyonensis]|uniref:glycosyltransferase n=1 Tax=Flagellimonas beolgyonensis TaxID=864064 RepID=UPI000F8E17F1|nr:glycosyltransferase [Allomuricauda beolgyonensis]